MWLAFENRMPGYVWHADVSICVVCYVLYVLLGFMQVFNKVFMWLGWCTLCIVWCFSGKRIRTLSWCFRRRWRRSLLCVRWLRLLWLMKATSWYTITDNLSPVLFCPVHLTQELHAINKWNQEVLFFLFQPSSISLLVWSNWFELWIFTTACSWVGVSLISGLLLYY